jgi:glutamate--cysteine ligase
MTLIEERLALLTPEMLRGLRRGVEKESLRVTADGRLANTPHPSTLGSPLTHRHITTDFSESQIELVTGVHTDPDACAAELRELHQFVYRNIGQEILWCSSMPCLLPAEGAIPIGRYGKSNIGRAKTLYRLGLSYRYGRRMQTISGVHYNFSLPETAWTVLQGVRGRYGSTRECQDAGYFSLIRNFHRHSWLLLYLFGASPALCQSFLAGQDPNLRSLGAGTRYLPDATSLRMGPHGYQSEVQAGLTVSNNCLASYARSLYRALTETYPAYAAIGLRDGNGYRQLSTAVLQIENEFYGPIRAKRPVRRGERPLHALAERGLEYVEVRCLDLDPFSSIGISAATMRFVDIFLLHCSLSPSPPDTPNEIRANHHNQFLVAQSGRKGGLELVRTGRKASLSDWGAQLLAECTPIADALDTAWGGHAYSDCLVRASSLLQDSSLTPAARVLREISQRHGDSYLQFALARSRRYRDELLRPPYPGKRESRLKREARQSLAMQREIEAKDSVTFDRFRQEYVSQDFLNSMEGLMNP